MALKWSDVAASPAFQALSFDEQEEARNQYFNEVVAPQVPRDEVDVVRSAFLADTAAPRSSASSRQELPAGVTPSTAGGGRGFINPPMVYEPQPQQPAKRGLIDQAKDAVIEALPFPVKVVAKALPVLARIPTGKEPVAAPVKEPAEPKPYKDRREALDDAVNLLEEGVSQAELAKAFAEGGIKFEEIVAHGKKRGSDYFKQQPALPATDPELVRLAGRYPAPVTGEIKSTRPETPLPGGDVLLAGAKGVVRGFQMLMSASGAGGKPSSIAEKALQTADSYLEGLRSAAAVKDDERIGLIMDAAKDGTWTEQVAAAAKAAGVAPASLVAQGLGTSVPVILASLLPGVRESTLARLGTQLGLGATMGAGATKEAIYTAVKDDMLRNGMSKIEAEERAEAAQSYLGKNKDQIAIGMALGALASSTGVEKVIPIGQVSKVLAKSGVSRAVASAEQNVIGRGLIGGFAEALPEFAQGSAEQVAKNVALQREGRDVPTFQGAIGQGTLEALAGFGAGGLTSAAFGRPQAETAAPGAADAGPTAANFTPAGSPTAQAGLAPIVVPTAPGTTDVSTLGATGGEPGLRSPAGGDQPGGGLGIPGRGADVTGQLLGGDAGLPAVNAGANVPTGGATGQPAPGVALPRVAARATDQDLLARTEAAIAAPQNNNAVVQPIEQWVGRKGDGYVTEGDARQALPGRQSRFPDLEWTVEQMPSGKYRLAGYAQQSSQPAPTVGATEAGAGVTQPTQAAPIPEPITAPSGKPFSTQQTAAVFAQQNGITGYSTVEVDGGWAIQPTETTLGTQTPQAIQGQTQGQAPAISGAAGQGLAGSLQLGDAAQAGVPAVAGAAAPGVLGNARQLASAQSELGQPLAAGASEGERAAVVGGLLFSNKVKSAPISAIRLAQDRIARQSGVEFVPVLPDQLTEQQRAASLVATLNGQTATFIEQTGGDPQKMPNGLAVAGKHVMIDVNSEDAVLPVAMHEVFHSMPDNIRKPLEVALRKLFKPGMEGDFKKSFNYKDADLDKEIPAMITQAVTRRKDFWNELRQEMGNKDFSAVAELIITRLDNWVRGVSKVYGDGFVNKYVTDVNEARSLLAKAYAQSMRDQGLQPDVAVVGDGQVMASQRSRVGMNFKDVVKRTPELQAAAERVKAGEMTAAEYDALVNQAKPVEAYKSVPAPATVTDIQQALTSDKTERIGKASSLPAGHPVGLRLDIPAYSNHGTWVVSVHEQEAGYNAGKSIGYEPVAAATNVNFGVVEKAALNIASGKPKATIAVMKGSWKPTTAKQAYTAAQAALKSKDWVQVGMDPERHSYFYDRSTMEPVVSADEVLQVGPLVLAKNPVYGDKADVLFSNKANADATAEGKRVGSVDTHILAAVRGERSMADRTVISAEEKAKIRASAAKLKLPVSDLEAQVREHKAAHPIEDEWAPLLFSGVKKNEDTGKYDLQYKTVPYEFSNGSNGKALQPGTPAYKAQVDRLSGGMLAAVRAVYRRALDGDAAARKIIDQSGWYKEMRTRLRQEFGGLGDLFADLLGATSPNTPVRTNWDNSVEALRLLSQGNFDELMPRWLAWSDRVDEVETGFRAWFNDRLKDGMSKANIKKTSEYKEFAREASQAREMPDDLMPTKANGKKFGFNGGNVVRAFVDLWRVVKNADPDINRGGTAPKAINFSGNLIGFRARATIDVWAARMLQRLAGGLRIPSMAEGGVSGQALEDGRNTLQFGFGQDVFSEAVKLIRNDPELSQDSTLRSINDDDLQALVWFIEKEVWTKGNWTSAAGEGGSFELESDLAGIRDREAVVDLRRAADSSVSSTAEQRQQATADIARLKQEIESLPAIAQANTVLARNAERVVASKTAKPEDKLTSAQKEEIKAENAAARKAIAKARASAAVSSIERQIGKAQRTLKKPTVEESQATRAAAIGKLKDMSRTVDRFVGGVSIQQGAEQGVEATPPSDAQMAELAKSVEDAVIKVDDGATVIGLKSISTQGLYGSVERALDLEVIARAGFDARPMAAAVFKAADEAQQDAAFVARVLRPDEQFDPLKHRPGIEIYFRDMKQAEAAAKMMAEIAGKRIAKATQFGPGYFEVAGYTIIVDGRRTPTTRSGAMGTPVGMRIIYMPEFEARYGVDKRLVDASEDNIRDIVNERADNLDNFADEVMRTFNGVSFAGIFNYEVDTRFAGEYQGAIDAYTGAGTAAAADQGRGPAWQGRPVRESVAAAVGRVSVDGSQQGGELPGGDQVLASNRANRDRGGRQAGGSLAPLEGAPNIQGASGPDPRIVAVAEQYARDNGIGLKRQAEYVQVDPRRGLRIANAYEVMRHAPNDPKVKEAYSNLIKQTTAQYRALEAAGFQFYLMDESNDPYKGNPWNAMRDLRATQTMGVFATEAGFGSEESGGAADGNPMTVDTGLMWPYGGLDGPKKRVLANDLFRAVHDAFGHGMEGAGFREHGEENAWQAHARLFTGSAVGAITSETRGQNSWLNFKATPLRKMVGDAKAEKLHPDNWKTITTGEHNRTAKVEDTIFAEQKTGLMPEWTWTEGRAGDMPGITASNRGINIRNDGDNRYADLIVDGQKTMESRATDSLRPYVGRTVGIIRTGEGPAKLIGSAKIGEPIEVDKRQFRELESEHLVPRGSTFDIRSEQTKFLYPITDAVRFDQEREVTSRGIVAREVDFSNPAVTKPELDKDVVSLFKALQDSRGLGRIRAQELVDAHPMAETIRQVDDDFMDILERLDDAGLVKINCK